MQRRDIERGADVIAADGDKVGDVDEVQGSYVVVKKGFLFKSERYVPISAIDRVERDKVYLSVTKDEIDARGWDRVPDETDMVEERRGATMASTATDVRETDVRAERDVRDRPAPMREGVAPPRREDEGRTIELREEELRARKESHEAGSVEIGKRVVEEEKTLEVPVMREEVVVERHAVERRAAEGTIGESETIEVPVYEESVDVEKRAVVYEELSVGKQAVQGTERVTETVRREEAVIDTEGDVNVGGGTRGRSGGTTGRRGWQDVGDTYRQSWEKRSGTSGGRWEDAEPGYRYGYEMAEDPRYQGRDWSAVESDLRSDYSGWSQKQGYRGDSGWDRIKDNVREAWQGARDAGRRR